jgi:hypothetical protein
MCDRSSGSLHCCTATAALIKTLVRETDAPLDLEARHDVGIVGIAGVATRPAADAVAADPILGRQTTVGPRTTRDAVEPAEVGEMIGTRRTSGRDPARPP